MRNRRRLVEFFATPSNSVAHFPVDIIVTDTMAMRMSLSVLIMSVLLKCCAALGLPQQSLEGPSYSQQATAIWANIWIKKEPVGTIRIPSPDRTNAVTAVYDLKTDSTLLTVAAGTKQFKAKVQGSVGSELAWSSDSKAFFLTYSDAGLGGEYFTLVFYVSEQGLRKLNPSSVVKRAFGHAICSGGPSPVNVVGVAWMRGSDRILIAAQIPPLSVCDSYNTFKAFELALPSAVVIKSYGQIAAKQSFWSYLGKDLRDAPDGCVTDPKSCQVPDNHR